MTPSHTNPKAIVFDLDDTLYLERDFVRSGFSAVGEWFCSQFGMPDFAQRAGSAFLAGKRGHIFDGVLASYGLVPEPALVERLVCIYGDHFPSIKLLEDARKCLNALHGSYPLVLLTDGTSLTQRNKISALGIQADFELVIVTGELGAEFSKPHPLAFCMVEDRLGLHGTQLMYIGDNPQKDFQAPRSLRWQTVRVEREEGIYADVVITEAADDRIADLSALQVMLSARCLATPDQSISSDRMTAMAGCNSAPCTSLYDD